VCWIRGACVVIGDRYGRLCIGECGIDRAAEIDKELFIRFDRRVSQNRDGDCLARFAGFEANRLVERGVVTAGNGRVIGGAHRDRHRHGGATRFVNG